MLKNTLINPHEQQANRYPTNPTNEKQIPSVFNLLPKFWSFHSTPNDQKLSHAAGDVNREADRPA